MEVGSLSREVLLSSDSTSIQRITRWLSLPPPSFTRCPIGSPYGSLPLREDVGLTTFRVQTPSGLGPAYSPVALTAVSGEVSTPLPSHMPFGSSLSVSRLVSIFGLLLFTTFTSGSQCVDHATHPRSRPL